MMRRRGVIAATVSIMTALAVFYLETEGSFAMAKPSLQLGWEWRGGRALEQRAALRLTKIEKEGGGLFGIGGAPSLGGSLPDAQKVEAEVLAVDQPGPVAAGTRIGFRIPKLELGGAEPGTLVAVGLIGQNVVCLVRVSGEVDEASMAGWLPGVDCP